MAARRRASPLIIIPAALSLLYAIAVVIVAWRAPDKGFVAFTGHRVVHVDDGGVADRAGLREGDVIVAVDGTPVASTFDYAFRVLRRDPGEVVALGVTRDGARRDVVIEMGPSPPPWSALVATLLATVLLVIGLVARLGRPDDVDARRFYRTAVVYAVVYVGALSWTRLIVHPILGCLFLLALFVAPPIALDLALDFPHRADQAAATRTPRRLAVGIAAVLGTGCAVALGLAITDYLSGGGDRALPWMVGCIALMLAFVPVLTAIGLRSQLRAHRVAQGEHRAQLRWLLFGHALSSVPGLAAIPVAVADLDRFLIVRYQPFTVAIAVAWFVAYGLAVLRIRLADVDALIKSSLGYAVATGGAALVYLAIVLAAGWLTGLLLGDAGPWPHLVAGLTAAALFGPLRTRVGRWLDRRFFRDRRHYVEALRRASESLALLREPAELAREAVEQIVDAVRAQGGALYVPAGEAWTIASAVGEAPAAAPVAGEAPAAAPVAGEAPAAAPVAGEGGVAVAVRSRHGSRDGSPDGSRDGSRDRSSDDEVIAWLVLGPRRSGDLYSTEDRDLLGAIASQLAVALGNARAFGTIAQMSRALETQNAEIRELRDRVEDENRFLRARVEAATDGATLVGESKAMRELARTIERVARSDASVLILGESGTGKGVLARTLHATSARADGPLVQVDCGAIAASVFESELFGHERGAFTGASRRRIGPIELAHGGTLFLDEIGELPLDLQPKLLRVIEDKKVLRVGATEPVAVDVRIVAATHRDLEGMVGKGEFREDLYFRLRVVEIVVPPLRDRVADLPALCASLLPRVARRDGRAPKPIGKDAMARISAYAWPGNVRELENALGRALVLGEGEWITAADLDLADAPAPPEAIDGEGAETKPHDAVMEDIERRRLTAALREADGNQSVAARALGMPRTTFINKLRRYGLL